MRKKRTSMITTLMAISTVACLALPTQTYATTGTSDLSTQIALNGTTIETAMHIAVNDPWTHHLTSWLPIYYLNEAMQHMQVSGTWNGTTHVWNLTPNTKRFVLHMHSLPASRAMAQNEMAIAIHGVIVEYAPKRVAPDPYSGVMTTYVPVYYIEQALAHLSVQSSWNGTDWDMRATTVQITPSLPLQGLFMINQEDGWGLSGHHIWRTTNGGLTWDNASPLPFSTVRLGDNPIYTVRGGGADFLTASDAWIVQQTMNTQGQYVDTRVDYTTTGGRTWHATTIPVAGYGSSLSFVNAQDGWLMVDIGAAAGSEGVKLFHTTNGGVSWELSATGDMNHTAIPFSGNKNGIAFSTPTHGFMTGEDALYGFAWLYQSTDAGMSFTRQRLAIPSSQNHSPLNIFPPQFFGQHGILPVLNGLGGLMIYDTTNDGESWSPTALLQPSGTHNQVQFVDPINQQTIYVLDTKTNRQSNAMVSGTLYVTHNGGSTWSKVQSGSEFAQAEQVDFVSSQDGYLLTGSPGSTSVVFHTTDGGYMWTPMSPTVNR
ncbi:MAG: hypothetical protein OWR52_10075 [Acidibacillus sp.]|nr:hypothetical protein [Acidibacillus sp.]